MRDSFTKYRGDGKTISGERAVTRGEMGRYLADPELVASVNAMLAVERPLLVTGEAGTGKTMLAFSIAAELELEEVLFFPVRSDHQGRDVLYQFDNMQRFYDASIHDPKAHDLKNYLKLGPLGEAITSERRRLVLIDEIDKAPRDFPNDLLNALDKLELRIPELDDCKTATCRPIVIITSNRESQLPDPFLRRCLFHNIEFPTPDRLAQILQERLGQLNLAETLRERVIQRFLEIRKEPTLQKKPSTAELIIWVKILAAAGVGADDLTADVKTTPFLGSLVKIREDLDRVKGIQR